MNPVERIRREQGDADAWICLCGNMPCDGGFYPCDAKGNEVEGTPEDWTSGLYVCADCGRMIEPNGLWVVGRNPASILLA